jgi:hypothetical protein
VPKELPKGHTWITLLGLPIDVTEEEIREFLLAGGIDLPLTHIALSDEPRTRQMAIIALDKIHVADLVTRATYEARVRGAEVRIVAPGVYWGKKA